MLVPLAVKFLLLLKPLASTFLYTTAPFYMTLPTAPTFVALLLSSPTMALFGIPFENDYFVDTASGFEA